MRSVTPARGRPQVPRADGLGPANSGDEIPAVAIERLFQPFERGAVRADQAGLGLGLYICSEIAKAHEGTLAVTSAPGRTCFTFSMPLG